MNRAPIVLAVLLAGPAAAQGPAPAPVPKEFQPVCIPCPMPCAPSTSCPQPARPVAAAPVLVPAPGTFEAAQQVALETSTAGAVIHYTLDGSEPSEASPVYSGPIAVDRDTTVRAVAIAKGAPPSPVTTGRYGIAPPRPAAEPVVAAIAATTHVVVTKEKLELDDKIYFDTGKATIKPVSYSLLDEVSAALKSHEDVRKVRIEGHTDSTGDAGFNRTLSQKRAEAVRAYLTGKGIEAARLEAKGFGPDQPIAPNDTPKGREQNRRVEFRISQ